MLLKAILIIAVLALLVILGMGNPQLIDLNLKPIPAAPLKVQAGYMYYGFFGVGFILGAIMMSGGGKKASASPGKEKK